MPPKDTLPEDYHYPPSDGMENASHQSGKCIAPDPLKMPDFYSEEFKKVDDLDDNTGNYREFESLEGILTSDMKFHHKRKTVKSEPDIEEDKEREAAATQEKSNLLEKQEQAVEPLTILSRGRLLIIDDDLERALECAKYLQTQKIECVLCVPSHGRSGPALTSIDSFPFIETAAIAVEGCFAGFDATVSGMDGKQVNLSSLTGQQSERFDLVLDMQSSLSFTGGELPLGYYASGRDRTLIYAALQEIPEMRGKFQKPQFVLWRKDRCLHNLLKPSGCRHCIDTCPFGAVSSVEGRLQIDQHRCQGCGGCFLVCPAEAIEIKSPTQEDLLSRITGQLGENQEALFQRTEIVLYDRALGADEHVDIDADNANRLLFIGVGEIGRIGADILLTLLAHGVAGVILICAQNRAVFLQKALEEQVQLAASILEALQISVPSLRFLALSNDQWKNITPLLAEKDLPDPAFAQKTQNPAPFEITMGKRARIRRAAWALAQLYGITEESIELPDGSCFGTVTINDSCSLCMACVSSCPAEALRAADDTPRLSMFESCCHQCGVCATICPENAVALSPRLLLSREAAEEAVVLQEVEPFNCLECGTPFATRVMINQLEEKLGGHWMFTSERQLRRLKMCRSCRTRDALETGDYNR